MNESSVNPFDNQALRFLVLVNAREQHSLWPEFAPTPSGWQCVYGPQSHDLCSAYIEQHWLDIRPKTERT